MSDHLFDDGIPPRYCPSETLVDEIEKRGIMVLRARESHRTLEDAYEALLRGDTLGCSRKLAAVLYPNGGFDDIKFRVEQDRRAATGSARARVSAETGVKMKETA